MRRSDEQRVHDALESLRSQHEFKTATSVEQGLVQLEAQAGTHPLVVLMQHQAGDSFTSDGQLDGELIVHLNSRARVEWVRAVAEEEFRNAGLHVQVRGDLLVLTPAGGLTDQQRFYAAFQRLRDEHDFYVVPRRKDLELAGITAGNRPYAVAEQDVAGHDAFDEAGQLTRDLVIRIGAEWDRTLATWERAAQQVFEQAGFSVRVEAGQLTLLRVDFTWTLASSHETRDAVLAEAAERGTTPAGVVLDA